MEDNREEFWDRLEDVRTGMLEAGARLLPMTHNLEPEDGYIWFLTAKGTDPAKAGEAGAESRYIVANDSEGIYADIRGKLSISTDRAKLDEVWNVMASAWFDEGKDDPDLVLLRFAPATAEVWLGPESGFEAILSFAKAKLTGEEAKMGKQFSLTFTKTAS